MNVSRISPDDPRLTAYALGEMDEGERAAFEAALADDPAGRAMVDEIRATAAQLSAALAAESAAETVSGNPLPARTAAIIAGNDPRKLDGGPLARVVKFPRLYYVVGGLAAACFAVFVGLRPAQQMKARKSYTEVQLSPPASADKVAAGAPLPDERKEQDQVSIALALPVAPAPAIAAGAPSMKSDDRARRSESVVRQARREMSVQAKRISDTGISRSGAAVGGLMREPRLAEGQGMNTESYAYRRDSDFVGAAENPLSTFSIDVDTASYAKVRRFIRDGQLPPPDAVRIEEMVNYFPYHYAPPGGDVPFATTMEVAEAPWAPSHRLVRIGLKGREVSTAARPPASLVFLLDVSGSMNAPNKLPLVKESLRLLVGKLRADDRVAIVVYAGASGLALPSTPAKKAAEINAALDALTPGGSTNGAMGIQLAYDIAKANFVAGGVNRVILCTDGDFNVRVTNEGDLVRLVAEKARSGVFLTALGFGMGNYKDATLEQLADKGNGNYGYIDTRREAEKLLAEQVNGTLVTIAKDVKLQVEFNPAQVAGYRLIGYENRLLQKEDFNNDAIDAGEIGAGHTVTALYEIVPAGAGGTSASGVPAVDELKYRKPKAGERKGNSGGNPEFAVRDPQSKELLTLKVRYKEPAGEVSRKLEFPLVDRDARFADATADFKFAAAVAEFGMILRESPHRGSGTMAEVIAWAEAGTADDAGGYRGEFADMARRAGALAR
ncbi:MAG: von Willebrand factor [Verrucomicrobia bacterium]|nr:von Willebrand factor [Verrucomicrobiota bacterium]